jgi:putative ABC transport system permease protein
MRPALATARWALRTYAASTLLIVLAAAMAVLAALPAAALGGGSRLALPRLTDADLGIVLSSLAESPAALQQRAVATLSGILLGLAVAAVAVAVMTVLALSGSRAAARRSEVVARRAVGASRRQLRVSGLLEGIAMVAAVLAIGVPAGLASIHWALGAWPGSVGAGSAVAPLVAIVGLAVVIVVGALFSVVAIPRTPRRVVSIAHPIDLALPTLQLAISFAMLLAAAQLARQSGRLLGTAVSAARPGEIIALRLGAPPAQRARTFGALLDQLRATGAFDVVSLSSAGALVGMGTVDLVITDCGRCSQGGLATPLRPVPARLGAVSTDTFRAMGLNVLRGRGITAADARGATRVAVVNRSLARHFEGSIAVGRQILVGRGPADGWYTVVGVVEDEHPAGFGSAFQPPYAVYLSVLQRPPVAADVLLRPRPGEPRARIAAALEAMLGHGNGATIERRLAESDLFATEAAPIRWFERLIAREGLVVLAIAILGTFAVMQLWVNALLPELAVRRAVGARRRDVLGYVLLRAIGVALVGAVLGLWIAEMTSSPLASLVGGLPLWDLRLAPLPALAIGFAALLGALLPAWRAARADPAGMMARLES